MKNKFEKTLCALGLVAVLASLTSAGVILTHNPPPVVEPPASWLQELRDSWEVFCLEVHSPAHCSEQSGRIFKEIVL